ncbi:GNAT family N-acetyltransferase [Herminiimonas sp. KBW02]|uniref:GNAT family N-acetyltransferase n=1 Tax=Herminiimonas sp. KBW02 TaxID=2153363 RepID=UPI000F5B574A|nr:GNAT family N-acetyltransferase [Herminiimonas sp. KBW02]RQO37229.1 GNAT family N-acetyltransferase [Herminiimonas sp. KBW02]
MTVTISPIFLLDIQSKNSVQAELWDQITEKQLADWEAEWAPTLQTGIRNLNQAGVARKYWPQNRHWDWRKKMEAVQGYLAYPGFSVMCNGVTQGLMVVENTSYRCRLQEQEGQHLIYVEFIENAPWNRKELLLTPRYRGVGSILIRAAIELSKEEGFKGRIGLHSLPQANDWYANSCGMSDLGIDTNKEGLRYFEMTPAQAEAFIAKGN